MTGERYPKVDQMITAVTVRDGNARVLAGTVLVAKPRGIVVVLEEPMPVKGQVLTMLYGGGDRVLRLRTRVNEIIDGKKALVEPEGAVSEGERREFLRAESMLQVQAQAVGTESQPSPETSTTQARQWERQLVDLSGSGVSFLHADAADKGDLFFVQLLLPAPKETIVSAVGEVVRCKPSDDGRHRIAIHFTTIEEDDRDAAINYVFRKYYEALAHQLHGAPAP